MNPALKDGECFGRGFDPLPKRKVVKPGPFGPGISEFVKALLRNLTTEITEFYERIEKYMKF